MVYLGSKLLSKHIFLSLGLPHLDPDIKRSKKT